MRYPKIRLIAITLGVLLPHRPELLTPTEN